MIGRRVVVGALLLAVLAGTAGGLARLRFDTSTASFLPRQSAAMAAVTDKARSFGGDPIAVILESRQPRSLITDQRQLLPLLGLEGRLGKLPDVAAMYGPGTVLNQIAGAAQNLLEQIKGRRDALRAGAETAAKKRGLPSAQVRQVGSDAVAKLDRRYLPLLVKGLPAGLPTLRNSGFASAVVFDKEGNPRPQWHFVVPAPSAVAMLIRPREGLDQAGTQRLVAGVRDQINHAGLATSRVTVTGIPVVIAGLAHDVQDEFPLLAALVALAVALRFVLVPARIRWRYRLWPLAAALLGTGVTVAAFGWLDYPLSFGAAALLPLLLGIGSSFPLYIAALANLRRAVVMALASAVGFASLALSPLPFVAELGITLACGVLVTVLVALCMRLAMRDPIVLQPKSAPDVTPCPRAARPQVGRLGAGALVAAAVVGALGWVALPSLSLQSDPQQLARGAGELSSATYGERVLGSSGEVNVALHGRNVLSPEALAWQRKAEDAIVAGFGDQARPVLSPPDLLRFLGANPTAAQVSAAAAIMPRYLLSAVTRSDRSEAIATFGIRLQDLDAQGELLAGMRAALPPPPAGYRADLVGIPVAVDEGYRLISSDRYLSNLAGIVAAGVVLAVGLRRRWDAGRAMCAALLATGWGFAVLWVFGLSLSPLTVALGALTTVSGCEFVVLLAEARRRGDGWLRRSLVYVCLTSVAGYLALTASNLWILREFGLVLTGAVLLSYLAAQLVVRLVVPSTIARQAELTDPIERKVPV